jgi:hypothetical protein
LKYCGTAGKPGGKRRKQTSTCSIGRNRSTRLKEDAAASALPASAAGTKHENQNDEVHQPEIGKPLTKNMRWTFYSF